jgi:uridine kinase
MPKNISSNQQASTTLENSPRIIAITGGSGSGKSHIARAIVAEIGNDCIHLPLDNFYRDLAHLTPSERGRKNLDTPAAIDWATFLNVVKRLQRGLPAQIPQYEFETHSRVPKYVLQKPASTVIIEGLWLFHNTEFQSLYRQKIYIDCPSEIRLERRIKRDGASRNRAREQIIKQFNQHVRPCEGEWVLPQKNEADLVIQTTLTPEKMRKFANQIEFPPFRVESI